MGEVVLFFVVFFFDLLWGRSDNVYFCEFDNVGVWWVFVDEVEE